MKIRGKLWLAFSAWFLIMVVIVIFTLPDSRLSKLERISFATPSSAQLFFKNVRSFYYNKNEEGGGVFDAYRLNSLLEEPQQSKIHFVIYQNWRQHKAFIRVDTALTTIENQPITWTVESDSNSDTLNWPSGKNEEQFSFAAAIYRVLSESEATLFVLSPEGDKVTLFEDQQARTRTRLILRDYFRLTNRL